MRLLRDFLFITLSVVLIVLTRTVWHIGENVEFVTALSILAGYFLSNKKLSIFVPLFGLAVSDLIKGNTNIWIFTWSVYLLAPFIGIILSKFKKDLALEAVKLQVSGLLFTIVFFLWTNFGVVVTTEMYSKNIDGLIRSYINALPFLQNQLLGNVIIVPGMFLIVYGVYAISILMGRHPFIADVFSKLSSK